MSVIDFETIKVADVLKRATPEQLLQYAIDSINALANKYPIIEVDEGGSVVAMDAAFVVGKGGLLKLQRELGWSPQSEES